MRRPSERLENVDFPVRWDPGAPLPVLLAADGRAVLVFFAQEDGPLSGNLRDPARDPEGPIAVVTVLGCVSACLGAPGGEARDGHRLAARGLEPGRAQVVRGSRWKAELEAQDRAGPGHDPARWRELAHYVLWFHDSAFECVARGFDAETRRERLSDAIARAAAKLLE
jgi:hypothetical protein